MQTGSLKWGRKQRKGGQVIAEGTISDIVENKVSRIGAFLKPGYAKRLRPVIQENDLFEHGPSPFLPVPSIQ